ncbi:MAG: hypothetical protein OXU66_05790 [Gammaproteobacteria bacterium]|nr:hypothetical protein [Gammaproteobacteria bacterium]MDD9896974.1 hypothetical protein [Gammaproteobacteria bacterium]MDD9958436.1 hypothetical protein [Gammaproteobacteria bacterium]
MKIGKIVLQVIGILVLIPSVAMATLRFENRNADGPSILFPGGEMTSGELYTGPEPDWRFLDDIETVELQLNDPMASRLIYVLQAEGRLFIISGYMTTFLGRLWKEWAFEADRGNNQGVLRVNGVRYPRTLVRIEEGDILDGVSANLIMKYGGAPQPTPEMIAGTRAGIESGNSWVFELVPREL